MRLTNRIKKDISNHALNSFYRLNAKSADCYAFNLCYNKKGKLDYIGGWDWSNGIIDKEADYLFMLNTQQFIKINKV